MGRFLKKSCWLALAFVAFLSCKNNYNDVQQMAVSENEPIGVAENINLTYTDSGRVKANLISSKMLDFSNRDFSFNEFPEGVVLDLYDENNNKSVVVSDYGIVYNRTDLIDLQGNVRIATYNNDTLFAEQLYYDNKKEWLYTNKPVSFKQGQDIINGNGFDSDTKFQNAKVLEVTGIISVAE